MKANLRNLTWSAAVAFCAFGGAASADPQTCIALKTTELKTGKTIYLFSGTFAVADPQGHEAALQEWTQYATSRGFESMGCDPRNYKDELAGVPPDANVVSSGWVPSQAAIHAGSIAFNAGKRNYANASACVQNVPEQLLNKCEYPVKIAFCFQDPMSGSGNTFDKTCSTQNFGITAQLPAGEHEQVGTYKFIYFFACQAPAAPTALRFQQNALTGVCLAP
jgi:hypothetical protein